MFNWIDFALIFLMSYVDCLMFFYFVHNWKSTEKFASPHWPEEGTHIPLKPCFRKWWILTSLGFNIESKDFFFKL